MNDLTDRTTAQALLGRGAFTAAEFARMIRVSTGTARQEIRRLVGEGVLEELDETRKNLDEHGMPRRGRPSRLYRITP